MAYATCKTCGEGLDKPTAQEILEDNWACCNGHHNSPSYDNANTVILELLERVETLERKVTLLMEIAK